MDQPRLVQAVSTVDEFQPIEFSTRDGRRVTIRAIHPDDAGEMQAAVGRLSGNARYSRFMSPLKALPPPCWIVPCGPGIANGPW